MYEGRHRVMQRVYGTHNVYGYGKPMFECVMIHAGPKKYGDSYKSEILFGKVLGTVNIKQNVLLRPDGNTCVDHSTEDFQSCIVKKAKDYVLLRY